MFKLSLAAIASTALGIGALTVVNGAAFADSDMKSTYCKSGFYAGLEAGWDNTNYNAEDVLSEAQTASINNFVFSPTAVRVPAYSTQYINGNVDDKGNGGRLFAGYQFNPYFAMEAGYTQFHKTTFVGASQISIDSPRQTSTVYNAFDQYSGELTEHAADVVGKLTYPLMYGFGVFAKAGLAYIASDRHINTTYITSTGAIPQETLYTKSYQAVRPTYGAGIDYSIPHTSLDVGVAYTEIAGGGGIARADLLSLGISEKFA